MATRTSNPTGDAGYWNDPNTWGGNVPADTDSVIIASGDTVYYDATGAGITLAALTVTGTLSFVTTATPAGNLNSVAPTTRTGLGLTMANNASITGAGAIYVGNSTTDVIARPAAAATYAPNVTITLSGAANITVTTQRYYGWVPTTPTAHPAWTTITGTAVGDVSPPLATESGLLIADADLDVRQGEMILVGVGGTAGVMAEANKGLYTCNAAPAAGVITISTAGGLVTSRTLADCVAVYSRPILITKAIYEATSNTVATGVMQGVRLNNIYWTTGIGWTFTGITHEGNGNAAALTYVDIGGVFTDCVMNNNTTRGYTAAGAGVGSKNARFAGCVLMNGTAGLLSSPQNTNLTNCFVQNTTSGLINTGYTVRVEGCYARACAGGGLCANGIDLRFVNCVSAANDASLDLNAPNAVELYNTTLSTTGVCYNYGSVSRPTWSTVTSRNQNGTARNRSVWSRGGYGFTNQATQVYGTSTYGTMQFKTVTASTPIIYDMRFWMPANKPLTFTVPMYVATADTTMAGEVWVYEPSNDPLFFDPLWTITPGIGTTQCSATATYVVARTARAATLDVWQNVTVTVPAYATARPLVARVICMAASTGKYLYAYIDMMESQLLGKKRIYL